MSNQFTEYLSTDASAPSGAANAAGFWISVLDACLVNGYGSKTAAGWAKVFTGTNLAVYRAPSGVRHYFRLDNNTGAPASIWPVIGYESMSDVNTGTHQIMSGKILAGTANPVSWRVYADAVGFMLFILDNSTATWMAHTFGEFYSFVSSDSFRTVMRAGNSAAVIPSAANQDGDALNTNINSAATTPYTWLTRGHTGVGAAINASVSGDAAKSGASTSLKGSVLPYPNPADGGAYISPCWLSDPTTTPANGLRGRLRGFWHWLHPVASVNDLDTISGTGDLAGRSFRFIKPTPNSGVYLIETSATLETN